MKKTTKQIIGLLSIILFLLFFTSFNIYNIENSSQIYQDNNKLNLESSGLWNLTTAIFIDDTIPAQNWSTTAATYDWCSGYGNFTHPYIIEDIVMELSGSGTCITIQNSNAYFRIENCSLSNAQYGIILTDVSNGLINETIVFNMNGNAGSNGSPGNPGTNGQDGTESVGIKISSCSYMNISYSDISSVNGGPGGTGGDGALGP